MHLSTSLSILDNGKNMETYLGIMEKNMETTVFISDKLLMSKVC